MAVVLMLVSSSAVLAAEEQVLNLFPAEEMVGVLDSSNDSLPQTEDFASRVVRRLACYARNSHGFTFEAIGTVAPATQDAALSKCYSFPSTRCSAEGCRVVYLRQGD